MDRKSSRRSNSRADRQKKRKFRGNQHTTEDDISFTSASAAKLKKTGDEEVVVDNNFGYCIIEFFSVFATLTTLVLCAKCKQEIKFSRTAPRGLGFNIALQCSCETVQYIQSSPFVNRAFEINRRIVTVMRLLGLGREGINIFCSMMDICQGLSISTYYGCLDNLYWAAKEIYKHVITKAVQEEQELLSEVEPDTISTHLTVYEDGTWKKRGFTSLFGVTSLIGEYSKKVMDTVVKSSFCQSCNISKNKKNSDIETYNDCFEEHVDSCTINHKESAEKMKVDAVVEMFSRSVETHGVKYVKYIGDGDSKTFKDIIDINPYNNDPIVEKKECVAYMQTNESLDSLIWTFAPKHIHAGVRTIEIANYLAVTIFNEGFLPILKMMQLMGITVSVDAHTFAARRNEVRIDRSELRASAASKEATAAALAESELKNVNYEVEQGPLYGAGITD